MVERAALKAVAVAVDHEDRVVSWSSGAELLLGYDDEAVLGRPLQEVLDGRDVFGNLLCHNGCWLREMWGRGEPVQRFEVDARHADGHRLRLTVEAEPSGMGGWAYFYFVRLSRVTAPLDGSVVQLRRMMRCSALITLSLPSLRPPTMCRKVLLLAFRGPAKKKGSQPGGEASPQGRGFPLDLCLMPDGR